MTELELSDRLARGDPRALAIAYTRYATLVSKVVRRLVPDRAEAEELVQETFLQAFQTATRFQPERATVAAWLITIARSRAIDFVRARGARVRTAAIDVTHDDAVAGPDSLLELAVSRKRVRDELRRLPAEHRLVLELAWDEGLTQVEIAVRTQIPLGTIKTRTRAALLALREELRADE